MNKTNATFIKFAVIFFITALFIGKIYETGRNRPPLKYAHIPTSTKEYIGEMGKIKGQGFTFSDVGPFDWDNKEDIGYEKEAGWRKEPDKNFIVYYIHDNDAEWQGHAQDVLKCARENTEYLKELFGKYYYADDMNGRRLAIYLPNNNALYAHTVDTLLGSKGYDAESAAGVIITQIGPLGCLTKGIVLNPICFDEDNIDTENDYRRVLKHEMAHYVFFSSLDYSKNIKHYKWVSEGIAEYFSFNRDNFVHSEDSIAFIENNCKLNAEFPLSKNAAYWAGESFFNYLRDCGGVDKVKYFLSKSYTLCTDSIFIKDSISAELLHEEWVSSMRNRNGEYAELSLQD